MTKKSKDAWVGDKLVLLDRKELRSFLREHVDYLKRLKHRAKVRGGPDVSAMHIADEAIGRVRGLLKAVT